MSDEIERDEEREKERERDREIERQHDNLGTGVPFRMSEVPL